MALPPGTRLDVYEILAPIGAGGMGEVYRARDTRLGRDVALKVLPESLRRDAERLARLEREAQLLASLNHPHIAQLYHFEDSTAIAALVMELVEGPTLADRLARGSLSLKDALAIARQLVDALGAAHERGVIHRDLKPANIKVRDDGTVKVLDFGLAKAMAGSDPGASATRTTPAPMTGAGVVLGTAAYMSPEQARGHAVDKRTDIWAFGCVLFEMLAGAPAFGSRSTPSDTVAAILRDEPDWAAVARVPSSIQRLLRRCLAKDRKDRLADIADARLEIDDAAAAAHEGPFPPSEDRVGKRWAPLAVVAGVAAAVGAAALYRNAPSATAGEVSPTRVVRFGIADTPRMLVSRQAGDVAISPDGRTLAFVGLGDGGPRIWVRDIDSLDTHSLPGTEGVAGICWSPDGQYIGFTVGGRVKKVPASGGRSEAVTVDDGEIRGGIGPSLMSWGSAGTILYGGSQYPSFARVAAAGGARASVFERTDGVESLAFLPDGQHVLVGMRGSPSTPAGTFIATLDGGERTQLLPFPAIAQYADGHLLFIRDAVLYAQPFDLARSSLAGEPAPLVENVSYFSTSLHGDLVYQGTIASGATVNTELVWRDRTGRVRSRVDQAAGARRPALSPDGGRIAMMLRGDIWVYEVDRDVLTRLTSTGAGNNNPVWTPDGQRLLFHGAGFRDGRDTIFEMSSRGAPGQRVVHASTGQHAHVTGVTGDGKHVVYEGEAEATDLWVVPVSASESPRALVRTPSVETQGTPSPDGRWLAYSSDLSGRSEVYVQSLAGGDDRVQVSPSGGHSARWRRDSKELFYIAPDGMLMAARLRVASPLAFERPASLFQFFSAERGIAGNTPTFDVAADGESFVVSSMVPSAEPLAGVVINWPALVRKAGS